MFSPEDIAVFPLTADPLTRAHMRLAMEIADSGLCKEVMLVPSAGHPLKRDAIVANYNQREEMIRGAMYDLPSEYQGRVLAEFVEKQLATTPLTVVFTCATLAYIEHMVTHTAERTRYAVQPDIHLVVGSDYYNPENGQVIERWRKRDQILARGVLLVPRLHHPVGFIADPEHVRYLDIEPINGCSGDARRAEQTYEGLLPFCTPTVAKYIATEKIYQEGTINPRDFEGWTYTFTPGIDVKDVLIEVD